MISLVVLGLLLAFVAYLVAPAVRDRLVGTSPANTVGSFRRGMRALAHDDGSAGSYAGGVSNRSSDRSVPLKRGGRMRAVGSAPATTTAADDAGGFGAMPAAQRRQIVQVSLWITTTVLVVAGFLATAFWWLAGLSLVLTLAYMAAAHEAARREEERTRARKLARIRETNQLRAVPAPPARPTARITSLDERRRAVG